MRLWLAVVRETSGFLADDCHSAANAADAAAVPAAQFVQAAAVPAALNLPALQFRQDDEPAAAEYCPAKHAVQLVAPAEEMVPATHSTHFPADL